MFNLVRYNRTPFNRIYVFEQLKVKSDTGTGTDSFLSLLALIGIGDTGSGVDTPSLLAEILKTDTGSGSEVISTHEVTLSDVGSGLDAVSSLLAEILGTDTSAINYSIVHTFNRLPFNRNPYLSLSAVIESIVSKFMGIEDSGSATELAWILILAGDTGEGSDSVISRLFNIGDTGSGVDLALMQAYLAIGDTASAVDAIADLLFEKFGSDTGSGIDIGELLAYFLETETGTGVDAAFIYIIGKLLKVVVNTYKINKLDIDTTQIRDLEAIVTQIKDLEANLTTKQKLAVVSSIAKKISVKTSGG